MIFVGNRRVNQGKSADSAEIHQDDQNKLRKNTELRCDSKGKPDRSDSGRRFVKAGAKRQTFCRADNNAADKKQQEIHYGNGCGVFHCRTVNAPAADFGIVLLRQTENALRIRTASVVVFIPPAVEPGEPPTSMSRVIIALEEPVIAERSAVLKPAVLGVTD